MIISKPSKCRLTLADINSNYKLKKYHNVALAHCEFKFLTESDGTKIEPPAQENNLGFIDLKNDPKMLQEWLDYLNDENHSALLFVSADPLYHLQPMAFGKKNQFALAFEGFDSLPSVEILEKFTGLSKIIHNPTTEVAGWILDEAADYRDSIAILDNTGHFYYVNNYYRYADNGITYCISGKSSKYAVDHHGWMKKGFAVH